MGPSISFSSLPSYFSFSSSSVKDRSSSVHQEHARLILPCNKELQQIRKPLKYFRYNVSAVYLKSLIEKVGFYLVKIDNFPNSVVKLKVTIGSVLKIELRPLQSVQN